MLIMRVELASARYGRTMSDFTCVPAMQVKRDCITVHQCTHEAAAVLTAFRFVLQAQFQIFT